ncbi:MAG: hypothetical protein ABI134_34815, partial [Byssovorax sp.]
MKVDVIGGSIAGLSAAITLAREGADVHVHERASFETIDLGAGLGVRMDLVRAVLGDDAATLPTTVATKRVVWRAGRDSVEPMALSFTTYAELRHALRARVPAERYHAREGLQSIVQAARGAEAILTSRGRSLSDLLVCADGRHSIARSFFAGGRAAAPAFAGYVLLRALVPESRLRPGLRERMMSETLHLAATGRHHLVAYPAPGRLLNWGWYYGVSDADLARLRVDRHGQRIEGTLAAGSLSDETMARLHRSAEAWSDWPRALVADVLASSGVALHPIYEYASPRLANGAACLLGDAAHLASPITGSGVRLA